jgi:hypothetical protein
MTVDAEPFEIEQHDVEIGVRIGELKPVRSSRAVKVGVGARPMYRLETHAFET